MNTESIYSLLKTSFEYAFYSSISKHDKSFRKTRVVSLKNLNNHLQLTVPIDCACMQDYHHTLLDFLDGQTEQFTKWLYEIMTTNKYNQDSRRLNNQFLALESYQHFNSYLFILYKKDVNTTGLLSDEIMNCYKVNKKLVVM